MTKHMIKGRNWYGRWSAKARHCRACWLGLHPRFYARGLLRQLRFH